MPANDYPLTDDPNPGDIGLDPYGAKVHYTSTGAGSCDCNGTAYEKGHPCYATCFKGGGDDHQWYLDNIAAHPEKYDTGIGEGQWIAWKNLGLWDDTSKSFKNENVDASGNPISGTGWTKPVDCPDGTTKYNINQCLPLSDPRVGGSGNGVAAPKSGNSGPAPPPAPPTTGLAQGQLSYNGQELHDVLANFFNYRSGIFGTNDPSLSGATPRTDTGSDPTGKDLSGYFLPGGGLWWGGTSDLKSALAPLTGILTPNASSTAPFSTTTPATNTPGTHTCPSGFTWDSSIQACMPPKPDVSGKPAQDVVPFQGPLAAAVNNPLASTLSQYPQFT